MRSILLSAIVRAAETSTDDIPLHDFVRRIVPLVDRAIAATTISDEDSAIFQPIAESILSRFTDIDCNVCAGTNSKICHGLRKDDNLIVHKGGLCLQPFKKTFEFALDFSRELYGSLCPGLQPNVSSVLVSFSTTLLGHETNLSMCRDASASSEYRDGDNLHTEVKLFIRKNQLDRLSFLSVPYLICHEIICHTFQGILCGPPRKRQATMPNDYFAEGWMDYVAHQVFQKILNDQSKYVSSLFRTEHEQIAQFLHDDRYLISEDRFSGLAPNEVGIEKSRRARIELGVKAAAWFDQFLRNFTRFGINQNTFMQFSFDLNARAELREERQTLVCELYRFFSGRPDGHAIAQLAETVRRYVENGELDGFLNFR
ncbi:hypothetical protein GC163_23090 [bacterium]|nr:hypothetical protein [bacterium]